MQIRLYSPDESSASGSQPLSQFFSEWFAPLVLDSELQVRAGTVQIYADAINWWVRLTGDPPLVEISQETIAQFLCEMRAATYRRSPFGPARSLSPFTIAKHCRALRTVLSRVGPPRDGRNQFAAELLPRVPVFPLPRKPPLEPKECFSLPQMRAIVAAIERTTWSSAKRKQWRVLLGCLFYTGWRIGTIRTLGPASLRSGRLVVTAQQVTKTRKGASAPLHSRLAQWIDEVDSPAWIPADARGGHERLQRLAGVGQPMGWHAWRRAHAEQLGLLGAEGAAEVCRRSLDHSSSSTTLGSYLNLDWLRMALPDLG